MTRLMTLTIRIAKPAEADHIEEVMREAYDILGRRDYDDQQISSALTHIAYLDRALVDDETYFVVEEDGAMVGGGGWSKRRKLFNGVTPSANDAEYLDPAVDPARVRAMFVHPRWERRGIGRLIVAACEDAAREAGFTRMELLATLTGRPLYLACGYEPIEDVEWTMPDGVRMGGTRMAKAL
jgi:GNAT superfamily N-acetyltransferase